MDIIYMCNARRTNNTHEHMIKMQPTEIMDDDFVASINRMRYLTEY